MEFSNPPSPLCDCCLHTQKLLLYAGFMPRQSVTCLACACGFAFVPLAWSAVSWIRYAGTGRRQEGSLSLPRFLLLTAVAPAARRHRDGGPGISRALHSFPGVSFRNQLGFEIWGRSITSRMLALIPTYLSTFAVTALIKGTGLRVSRSHTSSVKVHAGLSQRRS